MKKILILKQQNKSLIKRQESLVLTLCCLPGMRVKPEAMSPKPNAVLVTNRRGLYMPNQEVGTLQ